MKKIKIDKYTVYEKGRTYYYSKGTYHLVLCRPELQLRRSLWFRIKGKLDKKHDSGKYVLFYDRKKLDDYYESGLGKKYPIEKDIRDGSIRLPFYLLDSKKRVETILGDTMFLVMQGINWLDYHYLTAKDMDDYASGEDSDIWSVIGWIVSDGNIRRLYREAEEEACICNKLNCLSRERHT